MKDWRNLQEQGIAGLRQRSANAASPVAVSNSWKSCSCSAQNFVLNTED